MKGMLHIYNDCTIDWHQACENMWSGLGWVTHTKYHLSYIKYAGKLKFFVTFSWIWNEVMVKMKGMLHIYNDCTIDWHQVCANMWSGLGWVAHTKYHPYSGRTHAWTHRCTDAPTWILCPPFGAFAPRGKITVDKVVSLRVLKSIKFNYMCFMTSLRGKNEVQVKFEKSMHNCNATLVHWHHTLGCQCSSFGTYAVHKVVPIRVLIAEKMNYFMTSLRGKNEVEVKFENSMHNYNATLVHWHHKLGCQCSSFDTYAVHKMVPVGVLIAEKCNYFMTSLRGKNEVEVKFENSMHNYNATLVHWHHKLGCQCSSFDTYAVHKMVPVGVLIAEKLNYFMTLLRGKNEVEVKIEKSMHNCNATLVHWQFILVHHTLGCQCSSFGTYAVHKVGPVKQSKPYWRPDRRTDGQTEIINLIVGLVTRNPPKNTPGHFSIFLCLIVIHKLLITVSKFWNMGSNIFFNYAWFSRRKYCTNGSN